MTLRAHRVHPDNTSVQGPMAGDDGHESVMSVLARLCVSHASTTPVNSPSCAPASSDVSSVDWLDEDEMERYDQQQKIMSWLSRLSFPHAPTDAPTAPRAEPCTSTPLPEPSSDPG